MFIVEDGTGVSDANSYVSVGAADAYFSIRNNLWSGDEIAKQSALIKATDYIDAKYHKLPGQKLKASQSLLWPRVGLPQSITGMPIQLIKATFEYAFIALTQGSLAPLPQYVDSGKVLSVSKKRVGPLEISYSDSENKGFDGGSSPFRVYPIPDMLMEQLLLQTGASSGRNRCYR